MKILSMKHEESNLIWKRPVLLSKWGLDEKKSFKIVSFSISFIRCKAFYYIFWDAE